MRRGHEELEVEVEEGRTRHRGFPGQPGKCGTQSYSDQAPSPLPLGSSGLELARETEADQPLRDWGRNQPGGAETERWFIASSRLPTEARALFEVESCGQPQAGVGVGGQSCGAWVALGG